VSPTRYWPPDATCIAHCFERRKIKNISGAGKKFTRNEALLLPRALNAVYSASHPCTSSQHTLAFAEEVVAFAFSLRSSETVVLLQLQLIEKEL
jgi:hypothetical protein